ncbi:MAG: PKD domain-containing protein [Bacteroidales bacterium]
MKSKSYSFLISLLFIFFASCEEDKSVPSADFSFAINPGNLSVEFTNMSYGEENVTWDFGDGGTSSANNPKHTYDQSGKYTVSLAAHNGDGTAICEQVVDIHLAEELDSKINTKFNEQTGMCLVVNSIADNKGMVTKSHSSIRLGLDKDFTEKVAVKRRITRIEDSREFSFNIESDTLYLSFLTPATTFYYQVRQSFVTSEGYKGGLISEVRSFTTPEMPDIVTQIEEHPVYPFLYTIKHKCPYFTTEIGSPVFAEDRGFTNTYSPVVFDEEDYVYYKEPGAATYVSATYFYGSHKAVNIESLQVNDLFMGYQPNQEPLRGTKTEAQLLDDNTLRLRLITDEFDTLAFDIENYTYQYTIPDEVDNENIKSWYYSQQDGEKLHYSGGAYTLHLYKETADAYFGYIVPAIYGNNIDLEYQLDDKTETKIIRGLVFKAMKL